MSIANTGMMRRPTHPGAMLRERRALSPDMALRLARLFGNRPQFWLDAQRAIDLWDTAEAIKKDISRIKPLDAA